MCVKITFRDTGTLDQGRWRMKDGISRKKRKKKKEQKKMASIGFKKAEIECNDVPCCIKMPAVERRESSGVKK